MYGLTSPKKIYIWLNYAVFVCQKTNNVLDKKKTMLFPFTTIYLFS